MAHGLIDQKRKINLQGGRIHDLKVLIAENPGYFFCCFLFYQKKGSEDFKVFTTRPFTPRDKSHLRNVHPNIAQAIK